jgi:hypothetical protein
MTDINSEINKGQKGAKRSSYQKRNFRELALKLLIDHTSEDVEDLVDEFVEMLLKDKEAFRSLAIYGLQNVKTSLHPLRGNIPRIPPRVLAQEMVEQQATEITKKITNNLLQFIMPSGKTLAQSTGAECNKVGGWFKTIGQRIGRTGIVGDKLTENDLQKMFKGSQRGGKKP